MAWLETDKRTGYFKVGFRIGERKFKKSLETRDRTDAKAAKVTVEQHHAEDSREADETLDIIGLEDLFHLASLLVRAVDVEAIAKSAVGVSTR